MIILRKFINKILFYIYFILLTTKVDGQITKLFINGNHEYKKYSSFDLLSGDKEINSKLLDSIHNANIELPVRLRIKIGRDTLWTDTFSIKYYYHITDVITGITPSVKNMNKQIRNDQVLFEKRMDESEVLFILHKYQILNDKKANKLRVKYFVVKFYNIPLMKSGFIYCKNL